MRRLMLYVLVIAGGVFIASCMGPKSVEQWMADLGIAPGDPLSDIDFNVKYSGTNAAGERRTRYGADRRVEKIIRTVTTDSTDFPSFYAARVSDRHDDSKIHINVFSQWAGEAYGLARHATFEGRTLDLKRIRIDKPFFGEDLSLSETLIMAVYEPRPDSKDAAAYRLASADPDPAAILALMMAQVDNYECIWCGLKKVCAVNPVCP